MANNDLGERSELGAVGRGEAVHEEMAAREFLLERFLRDFPWRNLADRANCLALLVTPTIRPFTRSLSPFGVIEATMSGSGKTILTCCIGSWGSGC